MPYLTAAIPGIGGVVKQRPEDFRVDEIPLAPFQGSGPYALLRIRKRKLTTHEAVTRIASAARIKEREVGFAGIKDARAVTTQWLSVPGSAAKRLRSERLEGVEILEHSRDPEPLRPGRLAGNAFQILIRKVAPQSLEPAREVLHTLERRGLPNAFGPQRFGTKGDSDLIGRALLREDFGEALRLYLGAPSPLERDSRIHRARRLFESGDPHGALKAFPHWLRNERRVLRHFIDREHPAAALAKLPKNLRLLFLSAHQSRLFNACLERRLQELDQVWDGDVLVDDARNPPQLAADLPDAAERVARHELSPAGPLYGPGLVRAQGRAGALEDEVFSADGTDPEHDWAPFPDLHLKGERRPYRVRLLQASAERHEDGLLLCFRLPKGAYATAVLAELQKDDSPA